MKNLETIISFSYLKIATHLFLTLFFVTNSTLLLSQNKVGQLEHIDHYTCGYEAPTLSELQAYDKKIEALKLQKSLPGDTIVAIPVVLTMIRDDNGDVPYYFLPEWRNFIFSKINHYSMQHLGARIYLADYREVDSTALYSTTETNNSVLVQDVYGPLGELDAINIFVTNDSEGSFAVFPDNPLFPQAFMSINYIGIQDKSETPEHEFGHLLGLSHTHQGTENGNSSGGAEHVPRSGPQSNCSEFGRGDRLCDTPADPGFNNSLVDMFGNTYMPDSTNLMSYYTLTRNAFTMQQDSVMEDGLAFRLSDPDYDILGFVPTSNPVAPTIDTIQNTHLYNYLAWNNVTDNLGYIIERSEVSDTTGFLPIYNGATHDDVNFYRDRSIMPGIDYWYRVIAVNSSDQYSNVVFIPTDYENTYCDFFMACNTFIPDSVKIVDPSDNLMMYDDDFVCTPEFDMHVEQTIALFDDMDYEFIPSYPSGQMYANFFIDLNHDGDFEDTGEWVIDNVWIGFGGIDTVAFNIPSQTEYGLRAGRIIISTLYNLGMFMPIDNACEISQAKFAFDIEIDIQQNPCVAIHNLTSTQATDQIFLSSDKIISDQIIDANVDYSAENSIDLLSGFEVLLGRQFLAIMNGCDH